jgi:hypothetical protein
MKHNAVPCGESSRSANHQCFIGWSFTATWLEPYYFPSLVTSQGIKTRFFGTLHDHRCMITFHVNKKNGNMTPILYYLPYWLYEYV